MTKKKSAMRQVVYRGFTIYEVARGEWRVGFENRGYYVGSDSTVQEAKLCVDRIIKSYEDDRAKKRREP